MARDWLSTVREFRKRYGFAGFTPPRWATPVGWIVIGLVALGLPNVTDAYTLTVATSVLTFAMLGVGLNIVVGYAGLLDLGYAAFFAIGAYVSSLLQLYVHLDFWATLPLSILAAAIAGVVIGYPTLRLRSDYLAIVTLGFGEIIRITASNLTVTGGPNGLYGIPAASIAGTSVTSGPAIYYLGLGFLAVILVFSALLARSRVGRAWRTLREDATAAEAVGIPTVQVKLLAYVAGAMVGGLAGPFFAARFGAVDPTSFTYQTSIQILIVVVLGGMGSLPGMLLGALVVVALPEALRFISDFRLLVFALGLIALMLVRPSGLWPVSSGARRHKERVGGHQPVAPPPIERGSDGDDFLLRVEHLKRWFGGVKAVDDVTFGIRRGEVLSIIGPNGAGKTTVFNCITGVTKASQGVIQMSGTGSIRGRSAHRIVGLGLARTFQGIRLFNGMTVAENVLVGMYAHRPRLLRLLRRPGSLMVSHRREHQEALYWLEFVGLRESADNLASQLSYGERRKLEVARALASGPQVLLLDEPAAGTNATEKQQLMKLVQQVRTSGVAVLLIEHDMNVVMGVSDRVMVMDHGRVICEGTPDHVQSDPAVIEAYLGRDDDLFAVADEPQEVAP